jgi:hypothetical protein
MIKPHRSMIIMGLLTAGALIAQPLKTPGEESRYGRYTQHEEIVQFLSALSSQCPQLSVQVIGRTQAVRDYAPEELFLCILSETAAKTPDKLDRGKPTLMITASQHGREQSAKEAALRLLRDLALGELRPLLRNMNLLIIPQTNPHGNRFDQRADELDLDMNRDHIKMESAGVRAIHHVFRTWMPEITIDVHERGDNYYRVALGCVSNINIEPGIQNFSRQQILTSVQKRLEKQRVTFHEYVVDDTLGINTASGASLQPEDYAGKPPIMRYSGTDLNDARNSMGIYQTFSFIQEGASRHDLATLQARTEWQWQGLRAFVEVAAERGPEMMRQVRDLRQTLLRRACSYDPNDKLVVRMEYARDEQQPFLDVLQFQSSDDPVAGVLKKDKKAGDLLLESELESYPLPARQKVVPQRWENWYPRVVPTLTASRPLGYIIPARYRDVVETLLLHDVEVMMFARDGNMEVEGYAADEVVAGRHDYLPPAKIEVSKKTISLLCKRGDFYIACAQPAANLLPCLLEPQSDYGLIRYWKFRLVPEQGDFFAFFRVVSEQKLPVIPYHRW